MYQVARFPAIEPPRGRVMLFVCDLAPTGVVRNTVALAERLRRAGHAVEITARHLDGAGFWSIDPGIRLTALEPDARASDLVTLAGTVPRLRRHLRRARPDILLSMGNRGHLLCWAASRGLDGPARLYRVSNDLAHSLGATGRSPRRWASGLLRRAGLRLIVGDAARIIAVSPSLMAEPSLAQASNAVGVPNGVDVAGVRRRMVEPVQPAPARADEPVVLAIGRHVEQKNFATLVAAAGLANRRRPLRLVILGRGSDSAKAELRKVAVACGFEDRLTLLDPVPNPFPYLQSAKVFALPSWWEGSSNALLEALACGTPVVASRTAGNAAEIIGENRFGLLVDPHDVGAMAAALCRQIDGPAILPGERALAYDLASTLARYAGLVSEVLDERVAVGRPRVAVQSLATTRPRRLAGSSN